MKIAQDGINTNILLLLLLLFLNDCVMQFYMKLLFQLRELFIKYQYCLIKVILIFNL